MRDIVQVNQRLNIRVWYVVRLISSLSWLELFRRTTVKAHIVRLDSTKGAICAAFKWPGRGHTPSTLV